jgi:hypothetical protein
VWDHVYRPLTFLAPIFSRSLQSSQYHFAAEHAMLASMKQ